MSAADKMDKIRSPRLDGPVDAMHPVDYLPGYLGT